MGGVSIGAVALTAGRHFSDEAETTGSAKVDPRFDLYVLRNKSASASVTHACVGDRRRWPFSVTQPFSRARM